MERKTIQLTFDYEGAGEAQPVRSEGTSAQTAQLGKRTLAQDLIEAVVESQNMRKALKRVKGNKGSPGADGVTIDDLGVYLGEHWKRIRAELLEGRYIPEPVRRVDIPKPDGGVRQLGIPAVIDRLIAAQIEDLM